MPPSSEVTGLLIKWCDGDQTALEQLIPLVENELHRIAHRYMRREHAGHTLQTTALVNEAFLRLMDQSRVRWQNRAHFFGIAATVMRRFLSNYARDRKRLKRGGGAIQVSLSEGDAISIEKSFELIALDDALNRLALENERAAKVVELQYFGGLSVEETAEVLKVSTIIVERDRKIAKAYLAREIFK
ncbi:MAG: sigma-70 family RNA polymerase sigma factor [Blastocatellia bacterium]